MIGKIESQLLELLETLIFGTLTYKNHTYMQNMLITTSISIDPTRVKLYLSSLNNYSIDVICDKLIKAKLYDEAIFAYKKFGQHEKALELICNYKNKADLVNIKNCKIDSNNPNIEKNILQNLIKIIEYKDLDDSQSIELIKHVLFQNKNDLQLHWENYAKNITKRKDSKYEENLEANKIKMLGINDMNNMKKMELIGQDGTSQVFKYSKLKYYAVKTHKLNGDYDFKDYQKLLTEYHIINSIKSSYIIKSHGFFIGESNQPPSIIMSLCHSSLDKQISSLKDSDKIHIIKEICNGMIQIHLLGIIHCDLKPHNILLTKNNSVKISDFGSSKILSDMTLTSTDIEGTLKYIAPERLHHKKFNEKVDIYAFGIILYFVLTGGKTPELRLPDVMNGKIPKIPDSINDFSKNLILKCISFDPNQRPSFDEILSKIEKNHLITTK